MTIYHLILLTIFSPLAGSLIAGLGGKKLGSKNSHRISIALMSVSFVAAIIILKLVVIDGKTYQGIFYNWALSGNFQINIGFLVDALCAAMMAVVTFISLIVQIYSIGYMADDPGHARFFSYMSFFTFSMLMLVSANNFLQLFFGWEGVGFASYLLIGFWFYKESAAQGSLKAFLVNRVGDFGFILGIAAISVYFGSLDYQTVFLQAPNYVQTTIAIMPHVTWSVLSLIGILLFVGAMGKSAQIPLHVWLPESMEGPTPISALIHAATMVTAGIFLVARLSPLFELSSVALSVVLVVGATSALFLGLLAFVEFDIKRVIAFSTMSQLGYMMAADGVSAFSAGIFHLITHACFKALLFLAAGSVIIALHHEQDLRKMGGLRKYLPITYATFLIGALALAAIPPFSGFYSKDAIIEAVHAATIPGAHYAYICLLVGAFVTAYYIFRAFFMAFHGKQASNLQQHNIHIKETPWSMLSALIILAIPTLCIGFFIAKSMVYSIPGLLRQSVLVLPAHDVRPDLIAHFHGVFNMALHAPMTLPFWFSLAGIFCAWFMVIAKPHLLEILRRTFPFAHALLVRRYGFDLFNQWFFVNGTKVLSQFFYRFTDLKILDHFMVDGSGRNATRIAELLRRLQSGYLYHYVFIMILGLLGFLIWLLL